MQFIEAKQALARKLDINYSDIANDGLFSDADLGDYVQAGVVKAWDYKPWPFTQKTKTATTLVSVDYYDYPQDVMNGSIYLLKAGGKEYKKLSMQDYLAWFEQNPNDTSRLWTENQTFIFINKLAYVQGSDTFDLYGKGIAPTLSNSTDLLPFSPITDNEEYSGNRAIVRLAFAEVLGSEKKKQYDQSLAEEKAALAELDLLWKPFNDERQTLQNRNRPFFNVPNFMGQTPPTDAYNFGKFNWPSN